MQVFWPLADEWRPERFLPEGNGLEPVDPRAYMPFLVGPRSCIGRNFALLELQIAACIIVGCLRLTSTQPDLDIIQVQFGLKALQCSPWLLQINVRSLQ